MPIIGTVSEDDIIKIVSLNQIDNEKKRTEDNPYHTLGKREVEESNLFANLRLHGMKSAVIFL